MALASSKYAPRTPAQSIAFARADQVKHDKETAQRLLSRLYWKAQSLVSAYLRAKDIWFSDPQHYDGAEHIDLNQYPFVLGMTASQAEAMFKVDFFEWYTLLERYITLCLSIMGVSVSGMGPRTNVNALKFMTNPDLASRRPEASHQFHANLLEALEDPQSPLYSALGVQDVRIQLGLAKDYRNRWKDADDDQTKRGKWLHADDDKRKPIKLNELDLQQMLVIILHGCQHALHIVQTSQEAITPIAHETNSNMPQARNDYHGGSVGMADTPLEFMEDAMDLD